MGTVISRLEIIMLDITATNHLRHLGIVLSDLIKISQLIKVSCTDVENVIQCTICAFL